MNLSILFHMVRLVSSNARTVTITWTDCAGKPGEFTLTCFGNTDALDELPESEELAEARNEAAYERQQESLMESGGPDDSAYRRDVQNAGRGHLLKP
jgi:hypothetical protein